MPNVFQQTGLRWLWIALLVLVADQVTKQMVVKYMDLYQTIEVIPMFNLTYVHNYGAAFSFLSNAGGWQRWLFTLIAVVISGLILYWLKQSRREQALLPCAFTLILGGALGNVVDRLMFGYVIDFLDFYYQQWHWPAFNIADSAICVGAVLLVIDAFRNNGVQTDD
ncbi:Signal peptidase II [Saliniradius amylolyticus]|uniref:Lipoprotein signal peptidase n=1 Tax=Saliniradius amylolyticus TaxID=2183582 RepID=A0A2S2E569_9ALTE|nr:signal peptidase II [Saliniradius amylolyticus]AWL12672.1 Signal peptidase II [Saliniradius amylolyticus]